MSEEGLRSIELRRSISALLAGEQPNVIGATLAQLLAMWLAGHQEHEREGLLAMHIGSVERMVPIMLRKFTEEEERSNAH